MSAEAAAVTVNPSKVVFNNANVGCRHVRTVSVRNASSSSKNIRFRGPATETFELSDKGGIAAHGQTVAAGLSVAVDVAYGPTSEVEHQDRLVVFVDDEEAVEIPLVGIPPCPKLEVYGQFTDGSQSDLVNFGLVVADGQVLTEHFYVRNRGRRPGDFSIAYTGSQPLKVIPITGTLEPGESIRVKVELIAQNPGEHVEELNITFEGSPLVVGYVYSQIVNRHLMLFTGDGQRLLRHIAFGPVYYGTDVEQIALLGNNSPNPVSFVAVLEEGAAGEETGDGPVRTATEATATAVPGEYGNSSLLSSLVTMHPNQGTIGPYCKVPVTFKFSPRFIRSSVGWSHSQRLPARRDYALFMHIEPLGVETDTSVRGGDDPRVEVAVTGIALPVQVSISQQTFDFGECATGDDVSILATIQNESPLLSAAFSVPHVAHFKAKPSQGVLSPGQKADILFTFCPSQMGHLKTKLHVHVHSVQRVSDQSASVILIPISVSGRCTKIQKRSLKTANKSGEKLEVNRMLVDVAVTDDSAARFSPRATACQIRLSPTHVEVPGVSHSLDFEKAPESKLGVQKALPDDLASSVRPHNRLEKIATPFTGVERYTYIDSDYTYSPDEAELKKQHKQQYIDFIQTRHSGRKKDKAEGQKSKVDHHVDLGMQPSSGLQPPIIKQDTSEVQQELDDHGEEARLMTSTQLAASQSAAYSNIVNGGLNAIPLTTIEIADCQRVLSPAQLRCIQINPKIIDFGQVCMRSVTTLSVNVSNALDQFIHIVASVDCSELRQSSPLSQVVPPSTTAKLPLAFESHKVGSFHRSVRYVINGHHEGHLIVHADVVSAGLHLSKYKVLLQPQTGRPPNDTYQGIVTLENKKNLAAEFGWIDSSDIDMDKPQYFNVLPAHGVVEPHKQLCCLVTYQPTFDSLLEGSVVAQVKDGNRLTVRCHVELGFPQCQFKDRRLLFGSVPLSLTTTRTTLIENTGDCHAFFKVSNTSPYPGMNITPVTGCIPVGGSVQLHVQLDPRVAGKFDTWINVSLRKAKQISLRVAGSVEMPSVAVKLDMFRFGGVYCGSVARQKFQLVNCSAVRARVMFDLSQFRDFGVQLPRRDVQLDGNYIDSKENLYVCNLSASETAKCELIFLPKQVAAYDFILPVTVNGMEPPPAPHSPWPPSPTQSRQGILRDIGQEEEERTSDRQTEPTPKRRVIGTALSPPLTIDKTRLEISLPSGYLDMHVANVPMENFELTNVSQKTVNWWFDLSQGGEAVEKSIFQFIQRNNMSPLPMLDGNHPERVGRALEPGESLTVAVTFCPPMPGQFKATIPLLLHGDSLCPYRVIELRGSLLSSRLLFDPPSLSLMPVPLGVRIATELAIQATGFPNGTELMVSPPDLSDMTDDKQAIELRVTFMNGSTIEPCSDKSPYELQCLVEFSSREPIAYAGNVTFSDNRGNIYILPISVSADNCILTVYSYLAANRHQCQLIRQPPSPNQQADGESDTRYATANDTGLRFHCPTGEVVLRPLSMSEVGSITRASTVASASQFAAESSSVSAREGFTYTSIASSTSSAELTVGTPREGARNLPGGPAGNAVISDVEIAADHRKMDSFVSMDFSEERQFLIDVRAGVERWFSSNGWPGHYRPVDLPSSLRASLTSDGGHQPSKGDEAFKAGRWKTGGSKRSANTMFDCVAYLCGTAIPGIPINSPLPSDPSERAKHAHWLYTTLLAFLKSQGAQLSSIEPETLLAFDDFRCWHLIQLQLSGRREPRDILQEEEEDKYIRSQFDHISTHAWMTLLLQTLKVFVLASVAARPATLPSVSTVSVDIDLNPLRSNIYGTAERVLLEWLNRLYQEQKNQLFSHLPEGERPTARWIVNFDVDFIDGLVIGTCLSAYAPFLIGSHLRLMYPRPVTSEECLHNVLLVLEALRALDFEYDIQADDFRVPNPILILLFCCFLYNYLPSYLPKSTINFETGLNSVVQHQVKLRNPMKKLMHYNVKILGPGASSFRLPNGNSIQVPSQKSIFVPVEYISLSLTNMKASLLFTSRRGSGAHGRTLVFNMSASISKVEPMVSISCQSVLYEKCWVDVEVANPFPVPGDFSVILVEDKKTVQDLYNERQMKSSTVATSMSTASYKQELCSAFFCSHQNIYLEAQSTGRLHVVFLPVHLTKRHCSLLFSCSSVGEFVYSINGDVTLPRPAQLPAGPSSSRSVRISSAALYSRSRAGIYTDSKSVSVWRCQTQDKIQEEVVIPLVNSAKDKALFHVTQLGMSTKEVERRKLTGTMAVAAITKSLSAMMFDTEVKELPDKPLQTTVFHVTSSSKYFHVPDRLTVSAPTDESSRMTGQSKASTCLQIQFSAKVPGHYPCQIVLWSPHDVRVFHIECIVSQGGIQAELEFTTSALLHVSQNIPVTNGTSYDWQLEAHLTSGIGFSGPPTLLVKALTTSYYSLQFRPLVEGEVEGLLVLKNTVDECDYGYYRLCGIAKAPAALDNITINCPARKLIVQTLKVPNLTNQDLNLKVLSDLSFIAGDPYINVPAGETCLYELSVFPKQRGRYSGPVTFTVDKSDERESVGTKNYLVWYNMDVTVELPDPESTIHLRCNALEAVQVDIPLTNYGKEDVEYNAVLEGSGLSGPSFIRLAAGSQENYQLVYLPKVVGQVDGKLILENRKTSGELWYDLSLTTYPPKQHNLPTMQCELAKVSVQPINLSNPLDEPLVLSCRLSNLANFCLQTKADGTVLIPPLSSIDVPLEFSPSSLGDANHQCEITFSSKQLGDWTFSVKGIGLSSQSHHIIYIRAPVSFCATSVVQFVNPLDHTIHVDVSLQSERANEDDGDVLSPSKIDALSKFCLSLSECIVGPKQHIDIPVSFAPNIMCVEHAELLISASRLDGRLWDSTWLDAARRADSVSQGQTLRCSDVSANENMRYLCWFFRLCGLPEMSAFNPKQGPLLRCPSRQRLEERIEVCLINKPPSADNYIAAIAKPIIVTNGQEQVKTPETVSDLTLSEYSSMSQQFTYRIVSGTQGEEESSVGVNLVRRRFDTAAKAVVLQFNVVFAPSKPFKHMVHLEIFSAEGGIWRFPIRLHATQTKADDSLVIEAKGLNKEACVAFRLNSQAQHPVPYKAFFTEDSDLAFTVYPRVGELMPASSNGTCIQVSYTPQVYGKPHQARLLIKTGTMQWTYDIIGKLPDYCPPHLVRHDGSMHWHRDPIMRNPCRNYVRENLEVRHTGISSSLKGSPLLVYPTRK